METLLNIFDLDHTLIDSSHRSNNDSKISKEETLSYWLENNTHDNIMNDGLLPLTHILREFNKTAFTNIAITARNMSQSDFQFLDDHNLMFHSVLHRGTSIMPDNVLKELKLTEFLKTGDYVPFLAFDDLESNLSIFRDLGFHGFNAIELNNLLVL